MRNFRLSYALGFFVTLVVGGFGALLPIVATQAMNGRESFPQIAAPTVLMYVIAFGGGALLGFVALARSNFKTYAHIVAGFACGGAFGGLLLAIGIAGHIGVLWVLGPLVPMAVGTYVALAVAPAPS